VASLYLVVVGAAQPSRSRKHVRYRHRLPAPTTRRGHATSIERIGNGAQRLGTSTLYLADDRENVRGVPICVRLDGLRSRLSRLSQPRTSSFTPRALARRRASRVRVAIMARSFSASAASNASLPYG
jgi:hypothetical protein